VISPLDKSLGANETAAELTFIKLLVKLQVTPALNGRGSSTPPVFKTPPFAFYGTGVVYLLPELIGTRSRHKAGIARRTLSGLRISTRRRHAGRVDI
jgi:hypothetical protein